MRMAVPFIALSFLALPACSTSSSGSAAPADAAVDAPFIDAGVVNTPFLAWTGVYSNGVTNLAFANFPAPAGTRCSTRTVPPSCYVIDCTGDDASAPPIGLASGRLELYDGANVLLSASPTPEGVYPNASSTSTTWSAGDAIGIRTAGAELAKFDAPLKAPPPITVTAPADAAGGAVVDRTQDLGVGWATTISKVIVAASQVPAGATDLRTSTRFICEFDGPPGSATVPAQAMASFSAGPATLNIGGGATADVMAGWQPVHVYAINAQTRSVTIK